MIKKFWILVFLILFVGRESQCNLDELKFEVNEADVGSFKLLTVYK